jgi:hypothetical protein
MLCRFQSTDKKMQGHFCVFLKRLDFALVSYRFCTVLYFVEKIYIYLSGQGWNIRGIIDLHSQTCLLGTRSHNDFQNCMYIIGGNDFNNLMIQTRKWKLNFIFRYEYQIKNFSQKYDMGIKTMQTFMPTSNPLKKFPKFCIPENCYFCTKR